MHRKIVHHPNSHNSTLHSTTASTIYSLAYTCLYPFYIFSSILFLSIIVSSQKERAKKRHYINN